MFEIDLQLFGGGGSSSGLGGGGGGSNSNEYYLFQLTRPGGKHDFLPIKAKNKASAQKKADRYAEKEGYIGKAKPSKKKDKYTKEELDEYSKRGSRVLWD